MYKKNTFKNISRYFSSSLFSSLLGAINAFIKPRLLSPELYGLWTLLNVIPMYSAYSHLGTRTAMRYLLPLNLGKKDEQMVDKIKGNVIFGSLYISILIAVILLLFGIIGDFSLQVKAGLLTMAVVVLLEWYYLTSATLLKGYQKFKLLTNAFYLKSSLTFILGVTFIYFFNIYGLYLSLILSFALVNFYLRSKFPMGSYSTFSLKLFGQFVKNGFPMLVFSLGTLIISTSDRVIIALLLDNEQLGYYGISIMILGFFLSIPDAVREVMEPELMAGINVNSQHNNIKQYFFKPLMNLAWFLPLVMGPVVFIVPVLIPLMLPGYTEGVIPTQIMIAGGYFLAMSYTVRGVIIANNLQVKAITVMLLCVSINVVLNLLFIQYGLGITGVAIGSSLSYMILFLCFLAFIKKNCAYSIKDWQENMAGIAVPFPLICGITLILLSVMKLCFTNDFIAAFFGFSVYTIVVYFLIKIAKKKYSLLKSIPLKFLF